MKITVDGESVEVPTVTTAYEILTEAGIERPRDYDLMQIINGKFYTMTRGTVSLLKSDQFITARKSATNG